MADWFDPRGHTYYAVGECDRCHKTFLLDELIQDGNLPGLRVCKDDWDQLDPYRLPPRQPDNIVLPFTRPDVPIALQPTAVTTGTRITEDSDVRITQDEETRIIE